MQSIRRAVRLRARLGHVTDPAIQFASRRLLHARLRGERAWPSSRTALLLAVYRHGNASILLPIVREGERSGWDIRLWALDRIHPSLSPFSRGAGKGSKFSLLNGMLRDRERLDYDWIIIADDDISLECGSLKLFLEIAGEAGFCLAQPAHDRLSYRSHDITLLVPFSVARLTTYVEIGPLFAVHRSLASEILPFPEGYGMGHGLDIQWSDLARAGARFGIVDLVALRHLMPVATQYMASIADERARRFGLLRDRGARSIVELQRTLGVWRPWQRRPSWVR